MSKIIVLGAGMVGSAIAIDLAKNHNVTIADCNKKALYNALKKCGDLNSIILDVVNGQNLKKAILPFDIVVCAVPGFLGFAT